MQLQFPNFQNYLIMQLQFFLPQLILHKYSVGGYSSNTDCGRDHRGKHSSYSDCGRDRRGKHSSFSDCGRDRRS